VKIFVSCAEISVHNLRQDSSLKEDAPVSSAR